MHAHSGQLRIRVAHKPDGHALKLNADHAIGIERRWRRRVLNIRHMQLAHQLNQPLARTVRLSGGEDGFREGVLRSVELHRSARAL